MKILVISDTHRYTKGLNTVLTAFIDKIDTIIHLGDGACDIKNALSSLQKAPTLYQARGNMDASVSLPLHSILEIENKKIIMAHGHRYPLGFGISCLVTEAKAENANAFFFGHTHIPLLEKHGKILIMNPGSLSQPRGSWGPSFALVELNKDKASIEANIFELEGTQSNPAFKLIFHS